MSSEKQYGTTPPLSTNLPTEAERHSSAALVEELRSQNNFESAAMINKRFVACN